MLAIVLANYCFKTSYLHFCASKWKIWQLAAHHEYNVLFIIVLGAATQQHFSPQVAYISLHPLRLCKHIDQTQGPMSYPFIADRKGVPFLSFPPPHVQTISLKKKILAT